MERPFFLKEKTYVDPGYTRNIHIKNILYLELGADIFVTTYSYKVGPYDRYEWLLFVGLQPQLPISLGHLQLHL